MRRGLGRAVRRKIKLLLRQYQNMQLEIPMPKSFIDLVERIKRGYIISDEVGMKELQTILAALHKARDIVGQYAMPGDRNAESAMDELLGVLDSEELGCALERVKIRLGSPTITPEVEQSKNTAAAAKV